MMKRWFIVSLVLLTVYRLVPAYAQDAQPLCYGWYSLDPNNESVITGEITNNLPLQRWTFSGNGETFVTIRMEVTDGTLDPIVYVIDETTGDRMLSASAVAVGNSRGVNLSNVALPSDGEYTLVVTRLGESNGTTTGSYQLSLEPGLANVFVAGQLPANQDARIYDSEVVRGTIPVAFQYDSWYFEGLRGQALTALVRTIDGSTVTGDLTLFTFIDNAWAEQTAISSDGGFELRLNNYSLPVSGAYALRVRPTFAPFNQYELTFGGSGGERPELPRCREAIAQCPDMSPLGASTQLIFNNVPALGSISAATPAIAYGFSSINGDVVNVTMERTGGNLDTFMGLADVRGNLLARDAGFDPARSIINAFEIPADGCYFIYASREGVGDGTTEGTFIVTATGIPEGDMPIVPQVPTGESFGRDIASGETAVGNISGDAYRIAYRFRTDTADTYTAIATRNTENLVPGVALYDAEFNLIEQVTANFVGNASNPLTFEAEAGVYYFIVVQREGGVSGTSNGDFTLSVVPS